MTLQTIYISAAATPFQSQELAELLAKSRQNNSENGVGGILVYHQGSFLQVLEGPDQAVEETLERIKNDPRHNNFRLLFKDSVEEPEYEEWSMGFVDPTHTADVIEGFVGYGGKLDAATMCSARAKKLIQSFKEGSWHQKSAA